MMDRYDGNKIFFTADTHFGDDFIIKMCNRPFKDSTGMDETLIRNWNSVVPENGIVFHLGDIGVHDKVVFTDLLNRLNGKKYLITGDHDRDCTLKFLSGVFSEITPQKKIIVDGQKILLNHYPFLTFSGIHANVWQLFGHCHLRPTAVTPTKLRTLFPTQYDVGVDNNNYAPASFEQIKEIIEKQCQANPMEQPLYTKM